MFSGSKSALTALVVTLGCFGLSVSAHSDEFDALRGKEIRAIIGGKPGAGTDVMGRAFFASLGRLLPDTTIHVQTISGGAGAAAVQELVTSKSNLVTISIFGNGPVYSQLLATEAIDYDMSKLEWIGSLADNRRVVAMRTKLGAPNIDTLVKLDRQPLAPSANAGSPNNIESLLINAITGTHLKVVPGFEDAQIDTMLMAGDADARLAGSFQIGPLIESGDMVAVLRISDGAYPESMQSLPKLADVARPDVPKDLVLLMETLNKLGRPYAAAPGTAPDVVAALRAAFPKVIEDEDFKAFMAKEGIVGGSTGGEELQAAMNDLMQNKDLQVIVQKYLACGKAMSDDPKATCQ